VCSAAGLRRFAILSSMPGRWPRCSVSTRVSSCCAKRRRRDLRMLLLTSIFRDAAEWGYLHPPVRQFMALFDGVRSPTRVQSGGADRSRPGHLRMFVERQALTLTPQSGREKRRNQACTRTIGRHPCADVVSCRQPARLRLLGDTKPHPSGTPLASRHRDSLGPTYATRTAEGRATDEATADSIGSACDIS